MEVLILGEDELRAALPMRECIEEMSDALCALAGGEVHQPARSILRLPDSAGLMGLMPAYRGGSQPMFGLKAICVMPGNTARGLDAHQGAVLLLDGTTGQLRAVLHAGALTAIRTAAVTAVATRTLARTGAGVLALIGAGVQARAHLEALQCVLPLQRVRVASLNPQNARDFAARLSPGRPFPIEPADSVEAAVRGADVVVTVTTATEPVLRREWLSPGAHVAAIGAIGPRAREIDTATMRDATLYTDSRESLERESGDWLALLRDHVADPRLAPAELGEVLLGRRHGRRRPDELTLFKSLGLAVEDLAAGQLALRRALASGAGQRVRF